MLLPELLAAGRTMAMPRGASNDDIPRELAQLRGVRGSDFVFFGQEPEAA